MISEDIKQSIFAIIGIDKNSISQIGTGFIINKFAHFCTAKHVIDDFGKYLEVKCIFPKSNLWGIIDTNSILSNGDIAIGQLSIDSLNPPIPCQLYGPLSLIKNNNNQGFLSVLLSVLYNSYLSHGIIDMESLSKGDEIIALGCSMEYTKLDEKQFHTNLNLERYSGTVSEIFSNYRDKGILKFPCAEIRDIAIKKASSGGPVLKNGKIVGVNCLSIDNVDNNGNTVECGPSYISTIDYFIDSTCTIRDNNNNIFHIQAFTDKKFRGAPEEFSWF